MAKVGHRVIGALLHRLFAEAGKIGCLPGRRKGAKEAIVEMA